MSSPPSYLSIHTRVRDRKPRIEESSWAVLFCGVRCLQKLTRNRASCNFCERKPKKMGFFCKSDATICRHVKSTQNVVVVCCSVLQRVAAWCSAMQRVAVCCSVLQCVTVRCTECKNASGSYTRNQSMRPFHINIYQYAVTEAISPWILGSRDLLFSPIDPLSDGDSVHTRENLYKNLHVRGLP